MTVAFFVPVWKRKMRWFLTRLLLYVWCLKQQKMFGAVPPTAAENTDHTQPIDRI